MNVHRLGRSAASRGWRRKTADLVAPRVPLADRKVRELLGLAFFALSLRYVLGTLRRAAS